MMIEKAKCRAKYPENHSNKNLVKNARIIEKEMKVYHLNASV